MVKLIDSIPHNTKESIVDKKANIFLSMKPTDDPKAFYRFRLLGFLNEEVGRKSPFIERFTHTKWGKTDDGKPIIESQVICPVTQYVKNWPGDRYDCPICRYANNNYVAYKESGYKDVASRQKSREFGRKFEALVPVYVVSDPLFDANNGKLKVIGFYDKKIYETFRQIVDMKRGAGEKVFNVNAVDFCIRFAREQQIVNEGQPNEYTFFKNVVKMMQFSKTPKEIAAIPEMLETFDFDDQYFISSTPDEIKDFYNTYCSVSMDDVDIPEDDEIELVSPEVTKTVKIQEVKAAPVTVVEPPKPEKDVDINDVDIADEVDSLMVEDGKNIATEKPAVKLVDNAAPAAKEVVDDDLSLMGDIDDLLK